MQIVGWFAQGIVLVGGIALLALFAWCIIASWKEER